MSTNDKCRSLTYDGRMEPDPFADPAPDTAQTAAEEATGPSRRDRKKLQTRDELIVQAARLFDAHGFDAVTTEQIAEAADVSQRTFFRHFSSKESVLYADTDMLRKRMRIAFDARPANEAITLSVTHAMMAITNDYPDDRDLRYLQARLGSTSPALSAYARAVVQASWEHELTTAIAERLGVDPLEDAHPEVLAGAAFSALRAATRQWFAHDGHGDLPEVLRRALGAIARLDARAA